jgi:adenylate cyclase
MDLDADPDERSVGSGGGRKLAAVVHADVVGYSRLIGIDDLRTVAQLRSIRQMVVDPAVVANGGRVVQTGGDSLLMTFDSVAGAVRCAVRVQAEMRVRVHRDPPDRRVRFRIGINMGDVIAEGGDLHGDSVNVAVRLQEVCPAGGICISRAVFERVRGWSGLDFQATGPLSLKNIARPIDAHVVRLDTSGDVPHRPLTPAVAAASQWDVPSLAVMPFVNLGGEPDEEYFSDGMAEDIITELSRSRALFVIARNSSFAYKGRPFDIRQIALELGVRYIHEGSIRRNGSRVRVNVKLIDAETTNHLWAERYDRDVADLFAVQDEISNAIVATIRPVLSLAEQRRAVLKSPESLSAWEAYQRGMWHCAKIDARENIVGRDFFRLATDLDPTFARPHHAIARTFLDEAFLYMTRSFPDAASLAEPLANKAVLLDPNDADAYVMLALVSAARGDLATELARAARALAIDPHCVAALSILGQCLVCSGSYDEGCRAIMTYLRHDQFDPRRGYAFQGLAIGRYLMGEYAAAVELATAALAAQPNMRAVRRWLIAGLGKLGRRNEAESAMRQAAELVAPLSFDDFAPRQMPWVRDQDHAHMMEGLREAGWQG